MRGGLAPAADLVRALAGEVVATLPVECCPAPCGARLHGPERDRGTCDPCAAGRWRAEREVQFLERIPEAFRWGDLARPLVPPDAGPGGKPVVTEEGRVAAAAWAASDRRCLTVVGSETGTGKTSLAGAVAAGWAREGLSFEWLHAAELDWSRSDHEERLRRALRAPRLVLDGIGQDLGTARGDSGVSAQRAPGVLQFATEMHQGRGPARVVLTVDMTRAEMMGAYGGGLVRRIATNSSTVQVLRLTRVKRPDYVEF